MNNSKMMIEEGMKQLDIMKYMLDTNQHEYFTILTDDDYVEIDRLICRGMKKDLAISHVAIMREFKSLKIKPRMKVSTTKEQILQRLQEMESFSAKVERVLGNKPRMGIIYGTGKPNNAKFDLRILNKKNI